MSANCTSPATIAIDRGWEYGVGVAALLLLSSALLANVGGRPAGALLVGGVGGTLVWWVLSQEQFPIECHVLPILAAATAGVVALTSLCFMRSALFLLASVGGGIFADVVVRNVRVPASPSLFGVSAFRYGIVGGVAVGFGVVTCVASKYAVRGATLLAGAAGVTLAFRILVPSMAVWATALTAVVSLVVGVALRSWHTRCRVSKHLNREGDRRCAAPFQ